MKFNLLIAATVLSISALAQTPCENGMAGAYPCDNVDLMSVRTLGEVGGGDNGNDIWGWTDSNTGKEYALYGRSHGTSFIDISDPANPIYLGNLPTHTSPNLWRDIKTFGDYAFIVSEANYHGMQVFDLTQLADVQDPPVEFEESAYYDGFGKSHNVIINTETGFAYGVGTSTFSGGLHIVDINDPLNPVLAGSFSEAGYTHDAQSIMYNGPDTDYTGKEVVFAFNGGTVAIVNCADKSDCQLISTIQPNQVGYIHQGWVTEDQRILLMDDETDELNFDFNTRTYIINIEDLDNPELIGYHESSVAASDHNQYVLGNFAFQSNYLAGLRILNIEDAANGNLTEVGYFDTNPESNSAGYSGTWSNYPYFESGNVVVSTFSHFFVVKPNSTILSTPEVSQANVTPNLYPVPAKNELSIQWNTQKQTTAEIVSIDVKVIKSFPLWGGGETRIYLNDLPAGIYLLRDTNQNFEPQRFVKQ
jgi:choice-of-anchor B domain-containing protein